MYWHISTLGKGKSICSELLKFVMVYRPPKVPGSEADNGNTDRLCQALRSLGGNVVIFGDFNMPGIDWDKAWSNCSGETMLLDLMGDKFKLCEGQHTGMETL